MHKVVMQPTVYLELPRMEYDAMRGWNASFLKVALTRTPAYAWNAFLAPNRPPSKDSPAFRIGTLLHQALLEPAVWQRIVPCTSGATTKAFAEAVKSAAANGKTVAQASEHELADRMAASVLRHPVLGSMFAPTQENLALNELTLNWIDPVTELQCRGRLDAVRITDDKILILDLKTTADAGADEFGRSAASYLYLLQAAFYADGLYYCSQALKDALGLPEGQLGGKSIAFEFVAVEKEMPHQVARYRLTGEQAEMGRKLYQKALQLIKTATTVDEWPSYSNEPVPLELPNWAWSQMEKLLIA